jgi:hypothetical protein
VDNDVFYQYASSQPEIAYIPCLTRMVKSDGIWRTEFFTIYYITSYARFFLFFGSPKYRFQVKIFHAGRVHYFSTSRFFMSLF